MHTKADHAKFEKLREQHREAAAAAWDARSALSLKYGPNGERWAKASEKAKLEKLTKKDETIRDRFFELLDRISPRTWRGVPSHWLMDKLTWEDAVTHGPLTHRPPPAYGYSERDLDAMVQRPDR